MGSETWNHSNPADTCSIYTSSSQSLLRLQTSRHSVLRTNTELYCSIRLVTKSRKVFFSDRVVSSYQLNAQFLYSKTIYMLYYNPRHVSRSTMLNFRRTNCIITASGIVTLCKRPYSMSVESGLQSAFNPAYCTAVYREWRYQMV